MQAKYTRGVYMPNWGDSPLHILTYIQDRKWVCHCLEYDLRGRSVASQEAAFLEMKRVIGDFFERTRGVARAKTCASSELWEAWNAAVGDLPAEPDRFQPSPGSN